MLPIYKIINVFTSIIIGTIILIFNSFFLEHLNILVGSAMIILSVESLTFSFFIEKETRQITRLMHNILCLVLGIIVLLMYHEESFVNVCVIWGVWSVIREEWELSEEVFKKGANKILAALSLIESAVVIVFSIMMIINATEHHAHTHIYLLAIEFYMLAVVAVGESIFGIIEKKKNKKKGDELESGE